MSEQSRTARSDCDLVGRNMPQGFFLGQWTFSVGHEKSLHKELGQGLATRVQATEVRVPVHFVGRKGSRGTVVLCEPVHQHVSDEFVFCHTQGNVSVRIIRRVAGILCIER